MRILFKDIYPILSGNYLVKYNSKQGEVALKPITAYLDDDWAKHAEVIQIGYEPGDKEMVVWLEDREEYK